MKASIQVKDNAIKKLRMQISQLKETLSEADRTLDFQTLDFQITQLTEKVTVLQEQNKLFRVENEKIKQHYKELYDSIKITRAKHIEQTTTLLTKNENLKAKINEKIKRVTKDFVKPRVLAHGRYAIDVEPISLRISNNRKYDEIERKNIIIANDNLIADCLSKEVFYFATNSELIVSRFFEMHDAHTTVQSHCLELEAELSKLKDKIKKDDHNEMVVQIVVWYLDSGCSKHMMGNRSRPKNFVKKFIGTVRFENDYFGAIIDGVELIKGSCGSNLYTISIEDMMKSSPICLFSKASKNKSWLWHRHLNHLNFDTINDLTRKDLVRGLPRLKFEKYHLCSACQLGKSKKHTHKPKAENTIIEVLHTLHMDLCEPMQVHIINEKKYILVIIDDYSRFTWVKFLRSKDKTPEFLTKFLT
nr:hypothetical protein [Tanacetum cinerariifolium]